MAAETQTIYLIEHPKGFAKIGASKQPHERLSNLQTACPFQLSLATTITGICDEQRDGFQQTPERHLQTYYSDYNTRREWFVLPDDERRALTELDEIRTSTLLCIQYELCGAPNGPRTIADWVRDARVLLHAEPEGVNK